MSREERVAVLEETIEHEVKEDNDPMYLEILQKKLEALNVNPLTKEDMIIDSLLIK